MKSFPHRYWVEASASADSPVPVASPGLETLLTAPPVEYDGPGDRWSPETLLVAAAADCFVLTFRAVAGASSLAWVDLRCEGEGELNRVERTTRFTGMTIRAFLTIPAGGDVERAARILEKSERTCLVANSLACPVLLEPHVATQGSGPVAKAPRKGPAAGARTER